MVVWWRERTWWLEEKKVVRKLYSKLALSSSARLKERKGVSRLWGVLVDSAAWDGRAVTRGRLRMSMRREMLKGSWALAAWDFAAALAALVVGFASSPRTSWRVVIVMLSLRREAS